MTVQGVTAVCTPLEIDIGKGGLDKIITSVPDTASETAKVEISFVSLSAPFVYHVAQEGSGELLITLPPQIYQIQAVPISNFVAIDLSGTAPLNFQPAVPTGSSSQLVFDFSGLTLNSSLKAWSQQLNTLGLKSVQLIQYRPDVVRLTVQTNSDMSYASGKSAGGTELVLWLMQPAAKKALLTKPNSGTSYYGIDASPYPGDTAMQDMVEQLAFLLHRLLSRPDGIPFGYQLYE